MRLPATTAVRCVAPGLSWLSRCPAHRSSPSTCRGGGPAISCSPGLSISLSLSDSLSLSLSLYISPSLSLSLGLSVRKLWVVAVELKLQLLFNERTSATSPSLTAAIGRHIKFPFHFQTVALKEITIAAKMLLWFPISTIPAFCSAASSEETARGSRRPSLHQH